MGGPVVKWKRMGEPRILKRLVGGIAIGLQPFKNPRTGKTYPFTFFERPDGVTVFALTDASEPEVILVRQFKQAVDWIVTEAPGGQARRGEDPDAVAARELCCETGFVAGKLVRTYHGRDGFWLSPRSTRRESRTYLATGCMQAGAQKLDRGEDAIEVWLCTPAEFWELVETGVIRSGETVLAAYRAVTHGALPPLLVR